MLALAGAEAQNLSAGLLCLGPEGKGDQTHSNSMCAWQVMARVG